MGQPSWREVGRVRVPERADVVWTAALDYISPTKLYRIVVEPRAQAAPVQPADQAAAAPLPPQDQRWTPVSGKACTADGDPTLSRNGGMVLEGCSPGALIGKVGGSTADTKPDKEKSILFSVGRHCVFSVATADAAKTGALYLGINDARETVTGVQGQLEAVIYEAL